MHCNVISVCTQSGYAAACGAVYFLVITGGVHATDASLYAALQQFHPALLDMHKEASARNVTIQWHLIR
jgi:hypothetical protein